MLIEIFQIFGKYVFVIFVSVCYIMYGHVFNSLLSLTWCT